MKRLARIIAGGVVCVAVALPALEANGAGGSCALRVNDESGLEGPWPLVGGLPLPDGAVRDTSHIRVVGAEGMEVPAQVDVATTYRDGSIRWALLSLLGSPKGQYRAEFGDGVKRMEAKGIQLVEKGGTIEINTGAAVFTVSKDNLLVERASLLEPRQVPLWSKGECHAYLIDNHGRMAKCAGEKAEIERTTLKSGPLRYVTRAEGWYVTDQGERVAKGITRISFFAGSAMIQVSHTLVFTEDTNKLWIRDYGIAAPLQAGNPSRATFDTSKSFDENVTTVDLKPGDSAAMLQDDFPHFLETGSHFSLSLISEGKSRELMSGAACGEWCDVSSDHAGLTVVVRDLAEQFPKELEATTEGIRVHLWPARCGREWDFRAATLVKQYWGEWVSQHGDVERMSKTPSNAQGSAKTHEIWLMPHAGTVDIPTATRQAHAVCKPVLLQADPVFLCASGAMIWPIYPRDEKRFPAEEAVISDLFDRTVLPYRVFPMTGLIEWGSCPYLGYSKKAGRWGADFYRTAWSVDYGLRRSVWNLYARSGERKYFEYGSRFDRHCADWDMAHWSFGDVQRGGFGYDYGLVMEPFHWRGPKSLTLIDNSGHDVANWLLDYYMTGDERAVEAVREYGDAMKRNWNEKEAATISQSVILKALIALYTWEWDPAFRKMMGDQLASVIDLDAPTGLSRNLNGRYGPLYKMDRSALSLYDYWCATDDERAKQAFLKLTNFIYRFNYCFEPPNSYQNANAFLYSIAYAWTGRQDYLRFLNFMLKATVRQEPKSLAEELKGVTDLNTLEKLPFRQVNLNMNCMIGMPATFSVVARMEKKTIPPWPMIGRYFKGSLWFSLLTCGTSGYVPPLPKDEEWSIVFEKSADKPVELGIFIDEPRPDCASVNITGPDGAPAKADIRVEERIPYQKDGEWTQALQKGFAARTAVPPPLPQHIRVSIPAEAPSGIYRLTSGLRVVVVQDASVDKISLVCPDGFWLDPYGMPLYFEAPQGLEQLKLFTTRPVTVLRPDGTVALDEKDGKEGELSIPIEGKAGAWCVMDRFRFPLFSATPHIRLLNVPSIVAPMPGQLLQIPAAPRSGLSVWTPPAGDFVQGVVGQAVHLIKGKSLTFARGDPLPDGSYAHFPGNEGTIEFWFRPDWSSDWLTSKEPGNAFVKAENSAGARMVSSGYQGVFDLVLVGSPGAAKDSKTETVWAGVCSPNCPLRAGEWTHFAAVWKIRDGKDGTTGSFALYINGHKQPRTPNWMDSLDGKTWFVLGKPSSPTISVGCYDGSLDELRISKVARYGANFEPSRQPFAADAGIAALFHFDGNTQGISGANAMPIEAH